MNLRMKPIAIVIGLSMGAALFCPRAGADVFEYVNEEGKTVEVEARLAGSGQGAHALELADGHIEIIPQAAVKKRTAQAGPEPLDAEAVVKQLSERFGAETFRSASGAPYIVGVVLSAPLPKKSQRRTDALLKKAVGYMKSIDATFTRFAKDVRFTLEPPRHSLVVLIFETDTDFNKYTKENSSGRGLSATNIAGFYSPQTNYLAIRMHECRDFATPLHEAIHQLCFNRNVFQRLAPIPIWFGEAIATAFEGDGKRIKVGPSKISTTYARQVPAARRLSWNNIVSEDKAFRGDVLAGEAYTHAWSLHWLLFTKHKDAYARYLKSLSKLQPLQKADSSARLEEFEEAFEVQPTELHKTFKTIFPSAVKRQRIVMVDKTKRVGLATTESNSAQVQMSAINRSLLGGGLEVQGSIRNVSPIRPKTFYVTVETSAGTYADWLIPNLAMSKSVALKKQIVRKLMAGGRGGPSNTFRVRVRSVVPGSREEIEWRNGGVPVPSLRPQ